VAAVDRGARGRRHATADAIAVSGRPLRRSAGGRLDVHVKLSQLQLRRPRQWGACWLALLRWRELQLDLFWSKQLGVSRKGTRSGSEWLVAQIDPGLAVLQDLVGDIDCLRHFVLDGHQVRQLGRQL
jgi:hypothetical protein